MDRFTSILAQAKALTEMANAEPVRKPREQYRSEQAEKRAIKAVRSDCLADVAARGEAAWASAYYGAGPRLRCTII